MTATWDIIDFGKVPEKAKTLMFSCPGCEREALLPVVGVPLAEMSGGIVFDIGACAMPREIRCRKCRRHFVLEGGKGRG